jgi:hypothetical protein
LVPGGDVLGSIAVMLNMKPLTRAFGVCSQVASSRASIAWTGSFVAR